MLQTLLNRLSQSPRIWGALRRIAENGFQTERVIIERELVPAPGARDEEIRAADVVLDVRIVVVLGIFVDARPVARRHRPVALLQPQRADQSIPAP